MLLRCSSWLTTALQRNLRIKFLVFFSELYNVDSITLLVISNTLKSFEEYQSVNANRSFVRANGIEVSLNSASYIYSLLFRLLCALCSYYGCVHVRGVHALSSRSNQLTISDTISFRFNWIWGATSLFIFNTYSIAWRHQMGYENSEKTSVCVSRNIQNVPYIFLMTLSTSFIWSSCQL